jgi:hypothetical protein
LTHKAITALTLRLSPHVPLRKTRLKPLYLLIVAAISARTVNLSHMAGEHAADVLVASTYRRLQRFFQRVTLPEGRPAHLVIQVPGPARPWHLRLDRTNWKIGKRDVTIVMSAMATRRFRVPWMWTVLDKAGNSVSPRRRWRIPACGCC